MDTITCLEITKFVLDQPGVVPSSLSSSMAANDLSLRYGLESQDPRNLYLVRAWDASKHLHDLTSNVTREANARIDSTISGKMAYRIHVHLECEPYTALNAPLTEVVVWKMREGASRAVVEQLLTKLMAIVTKIPIEEGKYKNGWGRIINEDKERQFIVLIGWTDMEAFTTAVANSPDGRAVLAALEQVTERQIRHMPLQKVRPRPQMQQLVESHL
ncbi:hypothetical protein BDY19DRAFT_989940 [Irpex rosettiformis]|uniref:Uncharacterized protein n=1 Tax=Irpex rosettiformis TaxID=378272 RepID=A0ACB8UFY9_9APHY|nr:hypothetical protein BDY19DRAFT_989940 [Irpex rosettiformis]